MEALVQSLASLCCIFGGQSDTGTDFSLSTSVYTISIIPPMLPTHSLTHSFIHSYLSTLYTPRNWQHRYTIQLKNSIEYDPINESTYTES
jgi:hypothetical protein